MEEAVQEYQESRAESPRQHFLTWTICQNHQNINTLEKGRTKDCLFVGDSFSKFILIIEKVSCFLVIL